MAGVNKLIIWRFHFIERENVQSFQFSSVHYSFDFLRGCAPGSILLFVYYSNIALLLATKSRPRPGFVVRVLFRHFNCIISFLSLFYWSTIPKLNNTEGKRFQCDGQLGLLNWKKKRRTQCIKKCLLWNYATIASRTRRQPFESSNTTHNPSATRVMCRS